jgi:hypothetical protein
MSVGLPGCSPRSYDSDLESALSFVAVSWPSLYRSAAACNEAANALTKGRN